MVIALFMKMQVDLRKIIKAISWICEDKLIFNGMQVALKLSIQKL